MMDRRRALMAGGGGGLVLVGDGASIRLTTCKLALPSYGLAGKPTLDGTYSTSGGKLTITTPYSNYEGEGEYHIPTAAYYVFSATIAGGYSTLHAQMSYSDSLSFNIMEFFIANQNTASGRKLANGTVGNDTLSSFEMTIPPTAANYYVGMYVFCDRDTDQKNVIISSLYLT